MNNTSLIKWNSNIDIAPVDTPLLVMYEDDSGDHSNYYTVLGYKVGNSNWWISDNNLIVGNILYWSELPEIN